MTSRMLSRWLTPLLSMLVLVSLAISAPASAHKDHKKKQPVAAQVAQPAGHPGAPVATKAAPAAMHDQMGEMMEPEADRSSMGFVERLMDWLGRTHPVIVHFPIAFFPAALAAAIVGRRRPAFAAPVRFLVVAGGIIAPVAALLGWFDAAAAEPGQLLDVHRWLGTAIGLAGLGLGIWAWRKPDQLRSTSMIAALAAITAAIVIQGWYGGAMVHGVDHMNW